MIGIPLSPPPDYEYTTTGPWWLVALDDDDRVTTGTYYALETAVISFWAHTAGGFKSRRRCLVDARGITILGIERTANPAMVGIRQTMDATLAMVEKDDEASLADKVEVLKMVELVRELNGGAK